MSIHVRSWTSGLVLLAWLSIACLPAVSRATDPGVKPVRFLKAIDLDGKCRRIGESDNCRAVVLVFMTTECPLCRQYVPEINRLSRELADKPVEFYGVISDPSSTRIAATKFQKEFLTEFPCLFDASGELAATFEPTRVPEAYVIDQKGMVVYRGSIDDLYVNITTKRPEAQHRYLLTAVESLLAGKDIEIPRTDPVGCLFESKGTVADLTKVTYSRDIAPILNANCVECHRPGEVAPFSLLTYDEAAKRAKFIAEVTHAGVMPPWRAAIDYGHFEGERRLTEIEKALIQAWAEAGTPEGSPENLPPSPTFVAGWQLGKPDLVLTAPVPFTVPADGPDRFQHFIIPLDMPEDKVLKAVEFRPGNRTVVHHAVVLLDSSGVARKLDAESPEPGYTTFGEAGIPLAGLINIWAPGVTPRFLPDGIGMPLRTGSDLVLQLHLHPSGKEETDQSMIGLYFADKPVEKYLNTEFPFIVGPINIDIPPDAKRHHLSASTKLPIDLSIIAVLPHMHWLGEEIKVTATLPDGKEEPVIWIKDWNFYWQDHYLYKQPLKLPKGTIVKVEGWFDNTLDNPTQPSNPPQRVLFGMGTTDEMCLAIMQVVPDDAKAGSQLRMALLQSFLQQLNDPSMSKDSRERLLEQFRKFSSGDGDFSKLLFNTGNSGGN